MAIFYTGIVLILLYISAICAIRFQTRRPPLDFEQADADNLSFPPDFIFGAATSSHQVEGGTTLNNWAWWETAEHPMGGETIAGGQRCETASGHRELFDADLERMKDLGLDMYRFSLEWSRIEPEEGRFDDGAIAEYRSWCEKLNGAGVKPMVTLHHFTDPLWLMHRGGFENESAVASFARFVEYVVPKLADVVDYWITVNEPAVYAVQGWHLGEFPPGKNDVPQMLQVTANLMKAHAAAYQIIHRLDTVDCDRDGEACVVSFANNVVIFRPRRWYNLMDVYVAYALHRAYNASLADAIQTGRLHIRLPGQASIDMKIPELKDTWDFVAVNHYFQKIVGFSIADPLNVDYRFDTSCGTNDMGWGLTPQSLYEALMFAKRYRLPIIITENGTCDGERPDFRRQKFLVESLYAIRHALHDGADVRGYIHWSLLDNFEWALGFEPRFGLYRVDYETLERELTGGGRIYREIILRHRTRRPAYDSPEAAL